MDEERYLMADTITMTDNISLAMVEAYPELRPIYEMWKTNPGAAKEMFFKSSFYINNSAAVQERLKSKAEQRGAYDKNLDAFKLATRKRLAGKGVKLDEATFNQVTEQAYDNGMNDNQIDDLLLATGKIGALGGEPLGDVATLKSYANSFGVSSLLNAAYWDTKSRQLFEGTITTEDIKAEIRNNASSAFPAYSQQIQNGVSVDSIASAYKATMANILEVDADSITYDNPYLRRALQNIGPDGKAIPKPLWQFEKELRSAPEWEYTNNARNTIDSLSLTVLKDWGLA
jgi:hypothetical protein